VTNDFVLNAENDFNGVYLPLNFILNLKETKNFSTARNQIMLYDYLVVVNKDSISYKNKDDIVHSEISKKDISNFTFLRNNNFPIIIDHLGNAYLKVHTEISFALDDINKYIAEIVLDEMIDLGLMFIEGGYRLRIPAVNIDKWDIPLFRIETFDLSYEGTANLYLYYVETGELVFLERKDVPNRVDDSYSIYAYRDGKKVLLWKLW
jgi:hypothetical protein